MWARHLRADRLVHTPTWGHSHEEDVMSQTTTQTTSTLAGDRVTLPHQRSANDRDTTVRMGTLAAPETFDAARQLPVQRTDSGRPEAGSGDRTSAAGVTELAGPLSEPSEEHHRVRGLFTRFTHSPSAEQVELAARQVTRSRHDRVLGARSDALLTNATFIRGMR